MILIGLVQSRKVGIKLVGNILGWVAMILVIISAVFTLKDNKY